MTNKVLNGKFVYDTYCPWCKKILHEEQFEQFMESATHDYVRGFVTGICPRCEKKFIIKKPFVEFVNGSMVIHHDTQSPNIPTSVYYKPEEHQNKEI